MDKKIRQCVYVLDGIYSWLALGRSVNHSEKKVIVTGVVTFKSDVVTIVFVYIYDFLLMLGTVFYAMF